MVATSAFSSPFTYKVVLLRLDKLELAGEHANIKIVGGRTWEV